MAVSIMSSLSTRSVITNGASMTLSTIPCYICKQRTRSNNGLNLTNKIKTSCHSSNQQLVSDITQLTSLLLVFLTLQSPFLSAAVVTRQPLPAYSVLSVDTRSTSTQAIRPNL